MTEALSLLESSRGWNELAAAAASGRLPHSVAAVVPGILQKAFVEAYGKLVLGDDNLWKEGKHPDLIEIGDGKAAPSIDDCRTLPGELALHPMAAQKRLAVIWKSDELGLPAANSLLKLTEEPPEQGSILFVAAEDKLIPTIKSRVWSIYIDLPEELVAAKPYPKTAREWADWIERNKKTGAEVLFLEMEGWVKFLMEGGDYVRAANLETLIRVMAQKRLSIPMIQDLTHAVLKEEISCDEIFGNIW